MYRQGSFLAFLFVDRKPEKTDGIRVHKCTARRCGHARVRWQPRHWRSGAILPLLCWPPARRAPEGMEKITFYSVRQNQPCRIPSCGSFYQINASDPTTCGGRPGFVFCAMVLYFGGGIVQTKSKSISNEQVIICDSRLMSFGSGVVHPRDILCRTSGGVRVWCSTYQDLYLYVHRAMTAKIDLIINAAEGYGRG